ncbi:rhomboid family intramembrane serine protease [Parasegetibacter sp. NRK P23]|uniref:rhomboid family intramembrane serine protease n=1 Tax=Parasegetibacter sp. NRK P23 TaxID=2942999 RepID=UPI0020435010|nr:rhomboid family intramembrane serine protease [Parasegetibacter sp. NRK P23]MCM5528302.1 rhomboid family intramembrane serine protease [Parasegetibacter sp. NRK P23]
MTITIVIIILTAIISISAFSNAKVIDDLIFYPPAITQRKQWYRFITCGFIHADWAHLIFNMLSLYFFGQAVEYYYKAYDLMGKTAYILLYVSALVVSLLPTYFKHRDNYYYRSLGASGAVSAVVTAAALFTPWSTVAIFGIIKLPYILYVVLFIGISAYMSKRGQDNINHDAHLWGAIYGLVFTVLLILAFRPGLIEPLLENLMSPRFGR